MLGLDVQAKERIKVLLFEYAQVPSCNATINLAVGEPGVSLDGGDAAFDKAVAMNFLAAMKKTTSPSELSSS